MHKYPNWARQLVTEFFVKYTLAYILTKRTDKNISKMDISVVLWYYRKNWKKTAQDQCRDDEFNVQSSTLINQPDLGKG